MCLAVNKIPPDSLAGNYLSRVWLACVERVSEAKLIELAQWRGYSIEFCRQLRTQGGIGLYDYSHCKDCWAFPNTDITDAEIVSFHCRLSPKDTGSKAKWVYDPSGRTIHPLVRGERETALFIAIGESQWDLLTLEDKLGPAAKDWAFIATWGATGSKALSKLSIPASADVYLFPQNDAAGQKWLESVIEHLDRSVRVVAPGKHKDLNEWGKNGLSPQTLDQALIEAETRLPPEKSAAKAKPRVTEKEANKLEADALAVAAALDAFYDQERKEYVIKIEGERTYQVHSEAQFKRDLRFQGLTDKRIPYHNFSQIDIVLRFRNRSDT